MPRGTVARPWSPFACTGRESAIRMVVRDWGCGFDPSAHPAGFGLTSMRERAQSVGAVLTVSSEPGFGSQVEVVL